MCVFLCVCSGHGQYAKGTVIFVNIELGAPDANKMMILQKAF
jgi:hypothetical protein